MEATQAQLQGFITSGNAVTSNLTAQATALTEVASGGAAALTGGQPGHRLGQWRRA